MPLVLRLLNMLVMPPLWLAVRWYAHRHPEKYGKAGWAERLGKIPRRDGKRRCIWIHAVSVGEVNATRTLVDALSGDESEIEIVISTTTRTGMEAARRQYHQRRLLAFPLDFPWVIRRVLDRIRPDLIVLMELEVWPNLLGQAEQRGIPVCIANGRVTEGRSMVRFRKPVVRGLARWMFQRLAFVATQDEVYAERFVQLGVPRDRVHTVDSLKYDTAIIADRVDGAETLANALGIRKDVPLLVAGSTGPGEEELLLDMLAELRRTTPDLQLAIVPRKPERFNEVAALVASRGLPCIRRSMHGDGNPIGSTPAQAVVLGDTMGELRKFYSLADCVFVGRTLVPMGGSDMIEAAALGKPVVVGPHTENFDEAMHRLTSGNGIAVAADVAEVTRIIGGWLTDPSQAASLGRRAQEIVKAARGATQRTVKLIRAILPSDR